MFDAVGLDLLDTIRKSFMVLNADDAIKIGILWIRYKRTMIFDLDNTLYPESSFLSRAYFSFASMIANNDVSLRDSLLEFISIQINRGRRGTLLQDICDNYHLLFDETRDSLFYCLRYKMLDQSLSVYPWVNILFSLIKDFGNVVIITNGNPSQQRLKIYHLPLLHKIPESNIIFANEFKPKPSPDAAIHLKSIKNIHHPLYFGDDLVDAIFAKSADWNFFHVKSSMDQIDYHFPTST
jgi:FMN phosphatase YigB (HAD superfamily)